MKIILTCRITQYFNDCIIADDGDYVFSLDDEYDIIDVDEDMLDDFMSGYHTFYFNIEADVELSQLKYSTHLMVDGWYLTDVEIDDITVTMKDDTFVACNISLAKDSQIVYELDPDNNEGLIEELTNMLLDKFGEAA